jgi:hypothetical protein
LSAAAVGGVAGALALSRGLLSSTGQVVAKIGATVVALGAAAACLLLTTSPALGFALKLVEGALTTLIGLLCQAAVVLRADAGRRGRLQGLYVACGALALLAGKALAGALDGVIAPPHLYGGAGLAIGCAASLPVVLTLVRARRGRVPTLNASEKTTL